MYWIMIFIGLVVMILGADWLVRGCILLAKKIGVSEFIISIFIIGLGTSAPEFIISIISGINHQSGLVIGNAVGSNIINILGILGLGALIYPIITDGRNKKTDISFLLIANIVLLLTALDGTISKFDGLILISVFITYIIYIRKSQEFKKTEPVNINTIKIIPPIVFGLALIYIGSKYFMDSLNTIINIYKINEDIAGLLIVAPGTSMPELLVTIIAAIHRRPSIAIGNIIGSCMANITIIIASGALIMPLVVSHHILSTDIWVMLIVTAVFCWQLLKFKKLSKITGIIYLSALLTYFLIV